MSSDGTWPHALLKLNTGVNGRLDSGPNRADAAAGDERQALTISPLRLPVVSLA